MKLYQLEKITQKKKKRIGLGHGSGRGKTAGRGTKGQKARGSIPISFEGGALPLIKRLPFLRGKGKNKSFHQKPVILTVSDIAEFPKGTKVDLAFLTKKGMIGMVEAKRGVKILSKGDISVSLQIAVPVSQKAAEKIQKAGGQIMP